MDFENWFQDRILAFKEAYLPVNHELKKNGDTNEKYVGTTLTSNKCIQCDNQHTLFKCNKYKSLGPADQLNLVKEKNLCFNCLKSSHQTQTCKSPNSCFQQACSKKHHRKHLQRSIRLIQVQQLVCQHINAMKFISRLFLC